MSVTFNGKPMPSFLILVGREISVLPELDIKTLELPRTIGSSFLYTKRNSRKFTLDFILNPASTVSLDDCIDDFAEWLAGDNFMPSKLAFSEQYDRYYMAQVTGNTEVSDLIVYGTCSVEFVALDPNKYHENKLEVTDASPVSLIYSGKVEQPFIAEVTLASAVSKVELLSDRTPSKITLTGTFPSGTKLIFDTDKKVIKVNTVVNMRVLSLDSQWFNLYTGTNKLSLKLNNSTVTTPLTIKANIAD